MMWGQRQKCSQLLTAEHQQLDGQLFTHLQLQCTDMTSAQATLARVTLSRSPQRADVIAQERWRASRCLGVVIEAKPTDFRFLSFLLTLNALAQQQSQLTVVVNVIATNCDVTCIKAMTGAREWARTHSLQVRFQVVSAMSRFELRHALNAWAAHVDRIVDGDGAVNVVELALPPE